MEAKERVGKSEDDVEAEDREEALAHLFIIGRELHKINETLVAIVGVGGILIVILLFRGCGS